MDLGLFEGIGFVFTCILIGIIVFFIKRGIPYDAQADFTAWSEYWK